VPRWSAARQHPGSSSREPRSSLSACFRCCRCRQVTTGASRRCRPELALLDRSNDVRGPEVHEPLRRAQRSSRSDPQPDRAGVTAEVTAEVTATPPAAGPTRRAVATSDSRLTAQRPVPCLVLIKMRSPDQVAARTRSVPGFRPSACGWKWGGLPRTRRRIIGDSRNLSSPAVTAGQPPRVKVPGSWTRKDGLDRTRPSPGAAATGFGGGRGGQRSARSGRGQSSTLRCCGRSPGRTGRFLAARRCSKLLSTARQ
jgi:hypothetical protein